MLNSKTVFFVLGATGRTGQHFVSLALDQGHLVRALTRDPGRVPIQHPNLEWHTGSIIEDDPLDDLLQGVDFVVSMLGDARLQNQEKINTRFVRRLIPAMRRQGVKRFLYQAGGFTKPYGRRLPLMAWILKNTMARSRGLLGQHKDNEAVIEYLVEEAQDIEWVVHRASILSDGPSKGVLKRSKKQIGLATFRDCAAYNYGILRDDSAIHTFDLSSYVQ